VKSRFITKLGFGKACESSGCAEADHALWPVYFLAWGRLECYCGFNFTLTVILITDFLPAPRKMITTSLRRFCDELTAREF